jgi:peptidoglycan hydrolase-like protein with peptidoglycan-binding domain
VTQTSAERRTLQQGSTGSDVHAVQRLLNVDGAGLRTDGIFGPATERAVVAFQRKHGLAVDGIVGRETWTALLGVR